WTFSSPVQVGDGGIEPLRLLHGSSAGPTSTKVCKPSSLGAVTVHLAGIEPAPPGWEPDALPLCNRSLHLRQYRWLGSNQRPSPYEGDALRQLSYTGNRKNVFSCLYFGQLIL